MSKCNISIELGSASNRYASGSTIRGVIKVSVDADCKCKALTVELGWGTHGQGRRKDRVVLGSDLFQGAWAAGEVYAYPFEITMPNGPHSYRGHYFSVDWYLRATADIPWAGDPVCEHHFLLVSGPKTRATTYIAGDSESEGVANKRAYHDGSVRGGRYFFGIPFMLVGGLLVGVAFFQDFQDVGLRAILGAVMGAAIFILGLTQFRDAIRGKMAAMKLKSLRVDWPEGMIQPRGEIPLAIRAEGDRDIHRVSASLVCFERNIFKSGNRVQVLRKGLFLAPISLQRVAEANGRLSMTGSIKLPGDALASFYVENYEVSWLVEVKIDLANGLRWERELYLDVRPTATIGGANPIVEDDLKNTASW